MLNRTTPQEPTWFTIRLNLNARAFVYRTHGDASGATPNAGMLFLHVWVQSYPRYHNVLKYPHGHHM